MQGRTLCAPTEHANPRERNKMRGRTSHKEMPACKAIVELLRRHGCQVEYPFAGQDTAFRGVFGPDRALS